jgi:hypothetical protein
MRIAGGAYFGFLQCQSTCPMTSVALPGTLTVRAFSINFSHYLTSFFHLDNLILATGAIKSAATPLPHPLYWHPTLDTSFSFFLKNSQKALVFPSIPTGIPKIRKTGATMLDSNPEDCLYRFNQS